LPGSEFVKSENILVAGLLGCGMGRNRGWRVTGALFYLEAVWERAGSIAIYGLAQVFVFHVS
jgi:hypothetical protein